MCDKCGSPWLVRYASTVPSSLKGELAEREWHMWRYREWLPLEVGEEPVSLGEGMTPMVKAHNLGADGGPEVWIKDESQNPTGTFKARGLSAAVTRAAAAGAERLTIPTAGNAGVAVSAYAARAGLKVRVFAPRATPSTIRQQIAAYGAELILVDGHIGDCGQEASSYAAEARAYDLSTLREPYRIEGKKTLGLEIAEQLDWQLPDTVIYPTGGGTGIIAMWKVFNELRDSGWTTGNLPRLYSVQSDGCAPVVRAFDSGAEMTEPWPNPETIAAGLRVPAPLGGRLILRALRASGGGAIAVTDQEIKESQESLTRETGIDASPEGGAAVAAFLRLHRNSTLSPGERVVVFNTGAGWLYR